MTSGPPTAKRVPVERTFHGDTVVDEYAWLRDREDPDTLAYLEAENAFTKAQLAHTEAFQEQLFEEIRAKAPGMRRLASVDRRSCEAYGGVDRTLRRFVDLGCTIAVEQSLLRLSLERAVEIVGRGRLGVWVPNTLRDLDFWLRQPVSQITSDRPDLALQLVAAGAR